MREQFATPDLIVRIKKKTDGDAALSCIRADGSVTWQRQEGQLGRFFPLHDLTHFAVESTLGFDSAFYGLVASGWDISSFAAEGATHRIPFEARLSEVIVGSFDLERFAGVRRNADELNQYIRTQLADQKLPSTDFCINESQMDAIRTLRAELFARWNALPGGDALELPFERRTRPAAADTKVGSRA
jgi:hypothetical protein